MQYNKDFDWKLPNGNTARFSFLIVDNDSDGYRIYIRRAPGIEQYSNHEAHYYTSSEGYKYICWDSYIHKFEHANAIMFAWVKNYAAMHYSSNQRRMPALPGGTFR